ncbi:SAM-dependent chlorinase/fluorinase [Flavobacteriaceae bacterium]|nr:SAM-dependent chlorinase/fluorinase [Flavobacteriaceae bacterium]MDB4062665.1 SAM-dependent chlorinase/fluorinase [Flavobacteriaceae bacterium]
MTFVTLTTDFGHKDYSIAVIKAALLSQIPEVNIIDISHQISPYNHSETAYILKNSYAAFPKGSIHIIGVESEFTPENIHLAMEFDGHFFIGADNGIFSLIKEELKSTKIVAINIHKSVITSFPVLDVFINVAAHISRDGELEVIGSPINEICELTNIKPVINPEENKILGSVIYIDNYGNVVTNITEKLFKKIGKTRNFMISARTLKFREIHNSYGGSIDFSLPKEKREEDGKKVALFNSAGHLELAVYKSNPSTVGSASSLFGLNYRDPITIEFD